MLGLLLAAAAASRIIYLNNFSSGLFIFENQFCIVLLS
jgi:hypothetical protein